MPSRSVSSNHLLLSAEFLLFNYYSTLIKLTPILISVLLLHFFYCCNQGILLLTIATVASLYWYPSINLLCVSYAGPLISDKEKMLTPSDILKTDNDILKNASGNRKPNIRNEGSSSNSLNVMPPFNSHIVAADGENNAGRKKNFWKYLCFWSF